MLQYIAIFLFSNNICPYVVIFFVYYSFVVCCKEELRATFPPPD